MLLPPILLLQALVDEPGTASVTLTVYHWPE